MSIQGHRGAAILTKEQLREYKDLQTEIIRLDDELKELCETPLVRSVILDGLPRSKSISDTTADIAVKTVMLYALLNEHKLKAICLRKEIEECIEGLTATERNLMRERYIHGKDWTEVCVTIGYGWAQTHRLHSEILKKISKKR